MWIEGEWQMFWDELDALEEEKNACECGRCDEDSSDVNARDMLDRFDLDRS